MEKELISVVNVPQSFISRMQLQSPVLSKRLLLEKISSCFFLLDEAEISSGVSETCKKCEERLTATKNENAQTMNGLSDLNSSFNETTERLQPLEGRREQFTETKKKATSEISACLRKLKLIKKRKHAILMEACERGDENLARRAVSNGCDVCAKDQDGKTALYYACQNGHLRIAAYLINKCEANVNERDEMGNTILMAACEGEDENLVRFVVSQGCDVDARNRDERTALYYACKNGHKNSAAFLMKECGADVNATDAEGNCPLSIAVTNRNWSLAKLLIFFGCKLNEKWGTHKQTILHLVALQWYDNESLPFVEEIMPRVRALADCQDKNKKVPFELAGGKMKRYLSNVRVNFNTVGCSKRHEKGERKPSRVKVCLMGNSGAGKTTLMNSLRPKMSVHSRTAGVNIVTAEIDSAGELVFCDFVDQPTLQKMHDFFFSEATTIFILVVDLTMSEEELATCPSYWLSFVKCSIRMKGKAMLVLVGSRGDHDSGEKLKGISNNLKINFNRWFEMGGNFVLDCRKQESAGMQKLREYLGSLKQKCIKDADEVPPMVETLLSQVRDLLQKSEGDALKEMAEKNMLPQALFKLINISEGDPNKMLEALKDPNNEDIYSEINSALQKFGLTTSQLTKIERPCIHVGLLKVLIERNACPGLTNEELDLLVAFLHGIGEILVVENQVVLDPPWFCQSIIGPLMSPDDFPIHLEGIVNGIVSKDQVKAALKVFSEANQTGSIAVDKAIEILCHVELFYPVKELPDAPVQYQIPALIQTQDREKLWRREEDMVLFVGRRLQCKEKTDIITYGTMPFIQSLAAIKLHLALPIVWKGGLMMRRTINRCRIAGLIELHEYQKSIDFVVRGPHDSAGECMTLLNEMLKLGLAALEEKSAGTDLSFLYLSRTDLQKLSAQPLAYASEVVEHAKQLGSTTATVSCAVAESLEDLLAVPENHYLLVSRESRRAIAVSLDKDTVDRRTAFKRALPGLPLSSYAQCESAKAVLARWSESLCSTVPKLEEAATNANVLYILAILDDGGAIQLRDETKTRAKDAFFRLEDAQKKADSASGGVINVNVGGASAYGHDSTASSNHKVDITVNYQK